MKWAVYVLTGTLVAVIPCIIYPEFLTVFSLWEDWDRAHGRPPVEYSGANLPPAVRIVQPVFTAIVLPPTWLAARCGAKQGIYFYFAAEHAGLIQHGGSFHHDSPGLIAAGEYLIFGLPFWCFVTILVAECTRHLVNRRDRKPPPNSTLQPTPTRAT